MALKIKPLADRVLVEPMAAETKTASGIIIPDNAKEKPQKGKVIAVGNGRVLDNGDVRALEVKAGDTMLFGSYVEKTEKIEGQEYLIMREDNILGIVG